MVKAYNGIWRETSTFIKKDTMDAIQKKISTGVKVTLHLACTYNKKQDGTG